MDEGESEVSSGKKGAKNESQRVVIKLVRAERGQERALQRIRRRQQDGFQPGREEERGPGVRQEEPEMETTAELVVGHGEQLF